MKDLWLLGTRMATPTAQRIGATRLPRIRGRQAPVNGGVAMTAARSRHGWRLPWSESLLSSLQHSGLSIVPAQPEFTCPSARHVPMGGRERAPRGGSGGWREFSAKPNAPRPMAGAAWTDIIDGHPARWVERAGQVTPVLGGTGVGVIFGGGDPAEQDGSISGPKAFRRHVLPCLQEIVKVCHAEQLRSVPGEDGNPRTVAANQSDASCVGHIGGDEQNAGMEPGDRRKRHPDLTIWGSASCGGALPQRTPGQVYAEATLLMGGACPGDGIIPESSNAIAHTTPAENVWAMLRARDGSGYRRGHIRHECGCSRTGPSRR